MDKAFVVTGTMETERGQIQVGGIYFSNQEIGYATLADLGFKDASIHPARPLSQKPTEPTLYYFDRASHTKQVDVIRFNWEGNVVNRVKVQGHPSLLIPPASGGKADEVIYAPKAFVIKGCCGRSMTPVLAILIVKPEPGKEPLHPDLKPLKKMGLSRINSVEEVGLAQASHDENLLYVVERTPSAEGLCLARLDDEGKRVSEDFLEGDPLQLLPEIKGRAAEQLFRNGLRPSDFPKKSSHPPPSRRKRNRR